MLDYTSPAPGEAADRAIVTVVFLRMSRRPERPALPLPAGATLAREVLDVTGYRALYNEVGKPWLWWLRRVMPDDLLARHLANQAVKLYVLRLGSQAAGFFETEATTWPDINLNYFGLLPQMIGQGLGKSMLAAAIEIAFAKKGMRGLTVNTCTADHPGALPTYLAAGFTETRRVREAWDIPRRLGLTVPDALRG